MSAGDMSPLGSPKSPIESGVILYKIDFKTNKINYRTTDQVDAETEISDKLQKKSIKKLCDDEFVRTNSLSGAKAYVTKNDDETVYFVYQDAPKSLLDEIRKVTGEPVTPSGDMVGSADYSGGSRRRRRRPSRKYKKSKRVLRKKSRSTRRR